MIKKSIVALATIALMTGCEFSFDDNENFKLIEKKNDTYLINQQNGNLFVVKNTSMFKVKEEQIISNKINSVLKTKGTSKLTSIDIRAKLYNEAILFNMDIKYISKKIIPKDTNTTKQANKKLNIDFKQWRKTIVDSKKYYNIELVFLDKDGFKLKTKTISLKNITVNTVDNLGNKNGMSYEGSITINKYLASKIDRVGYYYSLPNFN